MSDQGVKTLSTRAQIIEIILIPTIANILFGIQWIMRNLPNIEGVTFFIIIFSLTFRKRTVILAVYLFALMQGLLYGFGIWWIMYLYVWPLLVLIVSIFKKIKNIFFWTAVSGIYGLMFGILCSLPYLFTDGWTFGIAWWLNGVAFDVTHGIGNAAVMLVFYIPMTMAMKQVKKILK